MKTHILSTSTTKRVNVITKELRNSENEIIQEGNTIMRVTEALGRKLVSMETHSYTTKAKLKSFMKRDKRLSKNKVAIKMFGSVGGQKVDISNGNTYTNVQTYKFVSPFYGDNFDTKFNGIFRPFGQYITAKDYRKEVISAIERGEGAHITGSRKAIIAFAQ